MKALILLLSICTSYSGEKIKGAFGIDFGSLISSQKVIKVVPDENIGTKYYLNPPKPYKSGNSYYALITPKTKKVYQLTMRMDFKDLQSLQKERQFLMDLFKSKYGSAVNTNIDKERKLISSQYTFKIGDIEVIIRSIELIKSIEVFYIDKKLDVLSKKESASASKIDTSGL